MANSSHIEWAIQQLNVIGYQIHNMMPEIVQQTPWSEVSRFDTNKGFVFLKKVPPSLSIEAKIIRILLEKFHAHVPTLIANNDAEHCFLMQDAGIPLHRFFKDNFQAKILVQIVQEYSEFQLSTIESIDFFLKEGLPDWRLEKLPKLYQDLIEHESLLREDGLNQDELITLKELAPEFTSICEKLSRYKIKDTFGHADFHDKNIVINPQTQKTTMIDLGEVVITHPFFSFLHCLHMAKENFAISDLQYDEIKIECFKPWFALESQEHLFEILTLIQQCWSIHAILGEFRLINSVAPAESQELCRQGRFANKFRHWINKK